MHERRAARHIWCPSRAFSRALTFGTLMLGALALIAAASVQAQGQGEPFPGFCFGFSVHGTEWDENGCLNARASYSKWVDGECVNTGTHCDDWLDGWADDDVLHGYQGSDSLDGKAGDDILHGGKGKDILYGGADDDVLHGGRVTIAGGRKRQRHPPGWPRR